jgi:hypothetical protein
LLFLQELLMTARAQLGIPFKAVGVDHAAAPAAGSPAAFAAELLGYGVFLQASATAGGLADVTHGKTFMAKALAAVVAVIAVLLIHRTSAIGTGCPVPVVQADIRGMTVVGM